MIQFPSSMCHSVASEKQIPHLQRHALVRRSFISLFLANCLTFVVVGVSYVAYSRLLSPGDFGLYSIALMLGSFGTLVLDAGLRNTIVKLPKDLTGVEKRSLLFLMTSASLLLLAILFLMRGVAGRFLPSSAHDYLFLAGFAAIYLISYPFTIIPTAMLERQIRYRSLAWIESVGIVLERGAPVVFLAFAGGNIFSFFWGLLMGRSFRVAALISLHRLPLGIPSWPEIRSIGHLVVEGSWLQLATGSAMVRDNLHILLVGPLFGRVWVGYYTWGLQLCMIASQIFIQISSRILLPVFAQMKSIEERWNACLFQIRLLSALTVPLLVAALLVVRDVDLHFLGGSWQPAIGLLPLLFLRMLVGLSTTPLSTLIMVQKGGKRLATASVKWAILEIAASAILILLCGPVGLAWSYAGTVWLGLWILLRSLTEDWTLRAPGICRAIFLRPSLAVAAVLASLIHLIGKPKAIVFLIAAALFIVMLSYLSEKDVRKIWRSISWSSA